MTFDSDCISIFEAKDISRFLTGNEKGVYAWYLPTPEVGPQETFEADRYVSFYQKFWERNLEDGKSTRYKTTVSPLLPQPPHKKIDQSLQPHWQNQLAVLAHFAPPIYVGKADGEGGLKERLLRHLYGPSDFLQEAAKRFDFDSRFNQGRFVIKIFDMTKFYETSQITPRDIEELVKEMELMLFWQCLPIFNKKRGT